MPIPFLRRPLALAALLALAACGGGEDGAKPAASSSTLAPADLAAPAAPTVRIAGFSPAQAEPGSVVTLDGSGFAAVTAVRLGRIAVDFKRLSDGALSFVVPTGVVSAPIELSTGDGQVVQSATPLRLLDAPTIESLAPLQLRPGQLLTLRGRNLDRVVGVRLAGRLLSPASHGTGEIGLLLPGDATSGYLTLDYGQGRSLTWPQPVTILPLLTLAGFSPARGAVGSTLAIDGAGLEQVAAVRFGGASASPASRSATRLTVQVPAGARSGPLVLVAADGSEVASATAFELVAPVTVSRLDPTGGPVGTRVTVSGEGLAAVESVSVGGKAAAIVARDAGSLSFTVPAGGNGAVVLAAGAARIAAGDFALSATPALPAISVARVDVAQSYVQAAGSGYQRLVPGKAALVRARVVAPGKLASPAVQLVAYAGGQLLGTVRMSGPAQLPASVADADLGQSFTAALPPSWVRAALELRVEADPARESTAGAVATVKPAVGTPTVFRLTLVPLITEDAAGAAVTGKLPTAEQVRELVERVFPVAGVDIDVKLRSPYRVSSVRRVRDGWGTALAEVARLQEAEAADRFYYGFVPEPDFGGGTAGIGYVPGRTAIGLDARFDFVLSTMTHEMGHNLGRPHAPCGVAGEAGFPYADGGLGPAPLYDGRLGQVVKPQGDHDVMSYCDGTWFSDYGYYKAQLNLEGRSGSGLVRAAGFSAPVDLVEIAGEIGPRGVAFEPVQASHGEVPPPAGGDHQLVLTLAGGGQLLLPFEPVTVADHPGGAAVGHFRLRLPDPGRIAALAVRRGGTTLAMAPMAAAQQQGSAPVAAGLSWRESGGQLLLGWDAVRQPYLAVRHVGSGGARTVLASRLGGGRAALSLAGLPSGGSFEFSLSDGLNARLLTVAR
ncbi:IPT/TIG domain-containing protein [Chitinimonas koreensis]|uniref:IPT/TIG domain-containing protein n=1 Tax=Chitinimonas koreensis TaxID=356302 RepID=UPI0003F99E41|nr:IPT/TIG domain-containing protein [Chitinimonas koreensis]QNM96068.1 IPT/TIG domain-containing protein [Chitinimonas koreensis]